LFLLLWPVNATANDINSIGGINSSDIRYLQNSNNNASPFIESALEEFAKEYKEKDILNILKKVIDDHNAWNNAWFETLETEKDKEFYELMAKKYKVFLKILTKLKKSGK
jgi:hypothetical protein